MSAVLDLTPRAGAAHPAARFVGLPWRPDFNCWHLVQAVQREVFGRELPDLAVATPGDHTRELQRITAVFKPCAGVARDGDILTMEGAEGLHVGVVVEGRLLHNVGALDAKTRQPHGSVMSTPLHELGMLGFGRIAVWRAA